MGPILRLLLRWRMRGKGMVQGSLQCEEGSENGKWTLKTYVLSPRNFEIFVLEHSENTCSSEPTYPGINNYWRCFSSFRLGHLHSSSDIVAKRHSFGRAVRVTSIQTLPVVLPRGVVLVQKLSPERCASAAPGGLAIAEPFGRAGYWFFYFRKKKKRRWNEVALPASGWIWNGLWVSPELY